MAIASCKGKNPEPSVHREQRGETMGLASKTEPPSTEELIEIAYRHYPRWYPDKETIDEYLVRYDSSPEIAALNRLMLRAIEDRTKWDALVGDVRAAFPGLLIIEIPLRYTGPSCHQFIMQYGDPPGSTKVRSIAFRLSHLAPVYDYYETHQLKNGRYLLKTFEPSPEAKPVADVVEQMIVQRFSYHRLEPQIGRISLPHISVGNLIPGRVTLADALFVDDPGRR